MEENTRKENATGDNFSLEKYLEVRTQTKAIVAEIKNRCWIGMTEDDGLKLIDEIMNEYNVEKKWHPNKFRINENTVKSFREPSEENIRLSDDDIFFVDIGPVINGHEGDYGKTFVLGQNQNYLNIQKAVVEVFDYIANVWKSQNLSGEKLYQEAIRYTEERGYVLNPMMKGHRIGDFPHHIHFRGGMSEIDFPPSNHVWILEIHIKDPKNRYGAFYEDILIK